MNISNYVLRDFLSWCWTNSAKSRILFVNKRDKDLYRLDQLERTLIGASHVIKNYCLYGRVFVGGY